jgi:glc operon protein GlcG
MTALVRLLSPLPFLLLAAAPPAAGPNSPQPPPASAYLTPIGASINLDWAKRVASVAAAEMRKNSWLMAIAVVDPGGNLIYYEKADNTQLGSAKVAINKARSAALYKRPTKALQDALAGGGPGLRVLALEGAVPVEGGVPLIAEGKLIGAIGVSGDTSEHDAQCATAGAAILK